VTFPEGLLFAYDSEQILPAARQALTRFSASLAKYPQTRAMIVGHTDARGTATYNQALSERRAQSAAAFIATEGIDRARLGTVGRGSTEPVAGNETDAGRHQNRRVEVAIYADEAFRRQAKTGSR
jgi:outer membrane protein OmpA-like peptidoglycan-associated protein